MASTVTERLAVCLLVKLLNGTIARSMGNDPPSLTAATNAGILSDVRIYNGRLLSFQQRLLS